MKSYKTERRALKRVAFLARYYGIWPGVIEDDAGCWRLTYDPAPWDLGR